MNVDIYLWLLALHTISIITWMAGLLYLPRLFVYHASVAPGSEAGSMLLMMEKRLLKWIMHPAMGFSWIFGVWMIVENTALLKQGWLHGKLLLVVILTMFHLALGHWYRGFAQAKNLRSERFFRMLVQAPALLMIVIVVLVIVKPF